MNRPLVVLGLLACVAGTARAAEEKRPPGMPEPRSVSNAYDMLENSIGRPIGRTFDLPRFARKVTHHPREAANVDARDEVRLPSTWWQPRVGYHTVTVAQMLAGPGPGTGPVGKRWTVTHTKDQGVTPGFQIKDEAGKKFVLKFDNEKAAESSTGAAVIGAKLFWAAGYNVADDAIAYVSLEDLAIDKDATWTDGRHRKHVITREYLEKLLSHVARQPDGRYRCVASRFLDGKPLGPFSYRGRRHDDPEDRIPHELRRELRGLWVLCSWTNHADSRGPNSLDMWVTEGDRSFVRHNLIDFSAILGAGPGGKRAYSTGTEYYVDARVMGRSAASLGLLPFKWEGVVDPNDPAVGFVESRVYEPEDWRPDYPNPAFDDRTLRDIRWGAHIVASFSDELIRAAVDAAHFSDPRTAAYLTRILIERRDKISARWVEETTRTPREIVSR